MGAPAVLPSFIARVALERDRYGPQHPCVKQTAPAPQSALVVHVTNVQTCCTHALPSTVETHEQPGVPDAQIWLHEVTEPEHASPIHVGTQNERGFAHCPPPMHTVPEGQQVADPPAKFGQQLVP
jgi:hypothetical protein